MRILATLIFMLATALPSLAATTWPAGTNTPNQTFYGTNTFLKPIYGNSGIQVTGIVSKIEAGSANTLVITNGNVGIGTMVPTTKLQVSGVDGNTSGIVVSLIGTGAGGSFLHFTDNTLANWAIGQSPSTSMFSIISTREPGVSGTIRLSIDPNSGNVGIGTTNATNKLSVNGDIGATSLVITNNATVGGTITLTNAPTFMTTNAAPAGYALGVTLPVVWFAITNSGNKYLVPGFTP